MKQIAHPFALFVASLVAFYLSGTFIRKFYDAAHSNLHHPNFHYY